MPDSILPSLTPTGAQASAPRRLTRSTLVLLTLEPVWWVLLSL